MMPKKNRRAKKGPKKGQNGLTGGTRGMAYESMIKVSGTVAVSPTTSGNNWLGIAPFGAGSATNYTPYSNGTNYASLSQWGDFRCTKIQIRPLLQLGATNDGVLVVAALDSTGSDLAGGSAISGAWNTIRSRQTSQLRVITPAQDREKLMTFRPVELNNRLWSPQTALANAANAVTGGNWGVLLSLQGTSATPVIALMIDWFMAVREPTLSGVLFGKQTPEEAERLERLERMAWPRLRSTSSSRGST